MSESVVASERNRQAEIAQRVKAATKGPWTTRGREVPDDACWVAACDADGRGHAMGFVWAHVAWQDNAEANAEFIAHAREDVPWLLAELAAAHATVEQHELTIAAYEVMTKAIETALFGDDWGRGRDELVERAEALAAVPVAHDPPEQPPCEHTNVERVSPLYVDGRPLYKCLDCDVRFTYEDDEPSFKGLAATWGPERMRHDPERT